MYYYLRSIKVMSEYLLKNGDGILFSSVHASLLRVAPRRAALRVLYLLEHSASSKDVRRYFLVRGKAK